jgi:D-proline reductase (dithiol) PrdB
MSTELDSFRQRYGTWFTTVKPLLEAGEFKQAFATYPFVRYSDTPWAPLRRPVAASTLALVSTGGFYLKGRQPPFDAANIEGDTSFRVFSPLVRAQELGIAHDHFPHHYAEQDINTILPLDHLHQFAREGIIGGIAERVYSISGYIPNIAAFADGTAHQIASMMQVDGVDAALIVPV